MEELINNFKKLVIKETFEDFEGIRTEEELT